MWVIQTLQMNLMSDAFTNENILWSLPPTRALFTMHRFKLFYNDIFLSTVIKYHLDNQ